MDPPDDCEAFLSDQLEVMVSSAKSAITPRFHDSRLLARIMTSILKLLDHHSVHRRLNGMQFLTEYLEVLPPNLLKNFGYFDVLFDTLLRILSFKEVELLDEAFPCVIKLLRLDKNAKVQGNERNPKKTDFGRISKEDQLLLQTLNNIDLFSEYKIKVCLARNLIFLMESFGIDSAKFLPHVLDIAESFSESSNSELQISALLLLATSAQQFPSVCLIRADRNILLMMKILLLQRKTLKESDVLIVLARIIFTRIEAESGSSRSFIEALLARQIFDDHFTRNMESVIKPGEKREE